MAASKAVAAASRVASKAVAIASRDVASASQGASQGALAASKSVCSPSALLASVASNVSWAALPSVVHHVSTASRHATAAILHAGFLATTLRVAYASSRSSYVALV